MENFDLMILFERAEELLKKLQQNETLQDLFCRMYSGACDDCAIEDALVEFDDRNLIEFDSAVAERTMDAATEDDIFKPLQTDALRLLLMLRTGCVISSLRNMLAISSRHPRTSRYHLSIRATSHTELLYWGLTRFALECRCSYYADLSLSLEQALRQSRGQP